MNSNNGVNNNPQMTMTTIRKPQQVMNVDKMSKKKQEVERKNEPNGRVYVVTPRQMTPTLYKQNTVLPVSINNNNRPQNVPFLITNVSVPLVDQNSDLKKQQNTGVVVLAEKNPTERVKPKIRKPPRPIYKRPFYYSSDEEESEHVKKFYADVN